MGIFQIKRTQRGCRVSIEGGLTAVLVPELEAALRPELQKPTEELVVDMAGTEMVDSTGIGLLVALRNALTERNGRIALLNVRPEIRYLFAAMRLTSRFNVSPEAEPLRM